MDGKFFCVGLALGMIGGALLVANSTKVRQLVKDSQESVMRKSEEISKAMEQTENTKQEKNK